MIRLLCVALLLAGCAAAPADPPRTVARVDLPRYLGTWYEIARLPMFAQDNAKTVCEDTTATYTLRADGRIAVLNRCLNVLDGDAPRAATGQAYAVPGSEGTKLRVSFFWPFFGDYWVIGLDPEYRWAVVGEPRRRYLWVLARTPAMTDADWAQAEAIARREGYALENLRIGRKRAT